MRPHRLGTALGTAALSLTLAGACSSEPEQKTALELDRTPSPEPTQTQTPTPSTEPAGEDAIPTSYPEVGLEFAALPEVTGAERSAVATYVAYERGLRQLSRTAELNALLTDNSAPSLTPTLESTVDYLRSNDVRYRGTAVLEVAVEAFGTKAAVLDLCTDASGLELVTAGTAGPVEGPPRAQGRVVLTAGGGGWVVTQYDTLEETC